MLAFLFTIGFFALIAVLGFGAIVLIVILAGRFVQLVILDNFDDWVLGWLKKKKDKYDRYD